MTLDAEERVESAISVAAIFEACAVGASPATKPGPDLILISIELIYFEKQMHT